jgi:hypothetical protein
MLSPVPWLLGVYSTSDLNSGGRMDLAKQKYYIVAAPLIIEPGSLMSAYLLDNGPLTNETFI